MIISAVMHCLCRSGNNQINSMNNSGISFFIDVQNDINELPSEIKVLPLLVKPNDEIYSFDFKIKKIFIKKKDSQEDGIVGYAKLKNGLETNEFYRIFEVHSCGIDEYHKYINLLC
jgi:hypothetical protein